MEFSNDIAKIKNAIWDRIKNITIIFIISFISSTITLYLIMKEHEIENNILFICLFTIILILIIFWIVLYRSYKKEYINFIIEVQENYILDKTTNIKYILGDNCDILKYKNGCIIIKNGKNEIYISKYLKDKKEFENMLMSVHSISENNKSLFSDIMSWLSYIFFVLSLYLKYINIIELYLLIGISCILTNIYSIIFSIKNTKKKHNLIIDIIISSIFIYFVSKNIYEIIIYIVNKN